MCLNAGEVRLQRRHDPHGASGDGGGRGVAVLVGLFGVGVLGVGIFPGDDPVMHPIFPTLAFAAGGRTAVAFSPRVALPFRYLSAALRAVALLDLVLFFALEPASPVMVIGIGGLDQAGGRRRPPRLADPPRPRPPK